MKKKYSLWLMAFFLAIALLAVVWSKFMDERSHEPWLILTSRIPMVIDDWQGEDVPLGANESVVAAVGLLNYKDYIYRVYRKNGREVYVYAMFWRQGDISVREMSGHTPDGCWVANGAKQCIAPIQRRLDAGDGLLTAPAEVRQFAFPPDQRAINTAWWHIWGGEIIDRSFAQKSIMPMLKEIWLWGVKRRGAHKDQILVRIHSELPIDEAIQAPPVRQFIKSIPEVISAKWASD